MFNISRLALLIAAVASAGLIVASCQLHAIGAGALLYPAKRAATTPTPGGCVDRTFAGDGVQLAGWYCASEIQPRRGLVVYLHGIADNRGGAAGVVSRFTSRGLDVVAYDSRAHGASQGTHCTYGYYEKRDLQRVIDSVGAGSVVLIGHSLGGAVAIQAAAIDPRVRAVVAASTFSDLRTIATERAPFIFSKAAIAGALLRAERDGRFRIDEVSPVTSAATLAMPVLLIHGEADRNTSPAHSQRILAALPGPKQLVLVPAAGHNDALHGNVWKQIEEWVTGVLARQGA